MLPDRLIFMRQNFTDYAGFWRGKSKKWKKIVAERCFWDIMRFCEQGGAFNKLKKECEWDRF